MAMWEKAIFLIAYLRLQALLSGAEKRVEALRQDVNILKQEREKLDVRPHAP
jgi:cell division protein FtsB